MKGPINGSKRRGNLQARSYKTGYKTEIIHNVIDAQPSLDFINAFDSYCWKKVNYYLNYTFIAKPATISLSGHKDKLFTSQLKLKNDNSKCYSSHSNL